MLTIGIVGVALALGLVAFAVLSQVQETATVRDSLRRLKGYELESVRDRDLLVPLRDRALVPILTGLTDLGRPELDWVSLAAGMGVDARRATTSDQFVEALRLSFATEGPTLIECVTLRMEGHAVHDDAFYVPKEDFETWAKKDPIERMRALRQQVWREHPQLAHDMGVEGVGPRLWAFVQTSDDPNASRMVEDLLGELGRAGA